MKATVEWKSVQGTGTLRVDKPQFAEFQVEYEMMLPSIWRETIKGASQGKGVNLGYCAPVPKIQRSDGQEIPDDCFCILTDNEGREHYLEHLSGTKWMYVEIPNAETIKAMKAARRGELIKVGSPKNLLESLNEGG